jgi:membrane-associated phospholipid phosphatase
MEEGIRQWIFIPTFESVKKKIAKSISILGHPLLTIPVFVVIALFNFESVEKASRISALIIGGIFIPLIVKMYRGEKKGEYTNFDVSDQTQRQSWYTYAVLLLIAVTIIVFATRQSSTLCLSVLFSTLLLYTSQLVNYYRKASLHISLNVFLFFMILNMSAIIAVTFLLFICLIAWARLILKRHTTRELVIGALIGLFWGILFLVFMNRVMFGM